MLVILTAIFAVIRSSNMLKIPWIWVWSPLWIKALVIILHISSGVIMLLLGSRLADGYIDYLEHVSF